MWKSPSTVFLPTLVFTSLHGSAICPNHSVFCNAPPGKFSFCNCGTRSADGLACRHEAWVSTGASSAGLPVLPTLSGWKYHNLFWYFWGMRHEVLNYWDSRSLVCRLASFTGSTVWACMPCKCQIGESTKITFGTSAKMEAWERSLIKLLVKRWRYHNHFWYRMRHEAWVSMGLICQHCLGMQNIASHCKCHPVMPFPPKHQFYHCCLGCGASHLVSIYIYRLLVNKWKYHHLFWYFCQKKIKQSSHSKKSGPFQWKAQRKF